jgi:hypothetical protein
LKYKFECSEKETKIKEVELQEQIQSLAKDKSRLDELICIKDMEITQNKKESKDKVERINMLE